MKTSLDISLVVPYLNEQDSLEELYNIARSVLEKMQAHFEMIFVDDGSTDNSSSIVKSLVERDNRVKLIEFRKNYGKAAALAAAFSRVQGNIVITMDADLQDDPNEIPNLVTKINEGYDLVSGWKKIRNDPFSKRFFSKIYNAFTSLFSGIRLHDFNCGLKAYKSQVVKTRGTIILNYY